MIGNNIGSFFIIFLLFSSCAFFSKKDSDKQNQLSPLKQSLGDHSQEKLIKLIQSSNPLISLSGMCYLGEFDKAEQKMDQLYLEKSGDPSYWNQIGNCYYLQGDLIMAKFYYKEALRRDPQFIPTINNLALVSLKQGEFNRAKILLKKASELDSEHHYQTVQDNLALLVIPIEK